MGQNGPKHYESRRFLPFLRQKWPSSSYSGRAGTYSIATPCIYTYVDGCAYPSAMHMCMQESYCEPSLPSFKNFSGGNLEVTLEPLSTTKIAKETSKVLEEGGFWIWKILGQVSLTIPVGPSLGICSLLFLSWTVEGAVGSRGPHLTKPFDFSGFVCLFCTEGFWGDLNGCCGCSCWCCYAVSFPFKICCCCCN